MRKFKLLRWGSALLVLFAGALFFNITPAYAVADLNIEVTDQGQALGGATVSLTFPDGNTQTYTDNDNDGRFGIVLGSSGRYRMTITTADGRSGSTTFRAPSDGNVRVSYDASSGRPVVDVRETSSQSARSSSPWSFNLLGTFGFTDWQGQFDDGSSVTEGETENMGKYGIGGGFRYQFPNYPLFLMSNFFYHAKSRSPNPFQSGDSFDLEMRERWKWQFLLGWTFIKRPDFAWALMVGVTLARVQMNILSGSSLIQQEKEVQAAPTFGTELAFPINDARSVFFVLGATAAIMNSISHEISGSNQFLRADNDLQWDTYAGFRINF